MLGCVCVCVCVCVCQAYVLRYSIRAQESEHANLPRVFVDSAYSEDKTSAVSVSADGYLEEDTVGVAPI